MHLCNPRQKLTNFTVQTPSGWGTLTSKFEQILPNHSGGIAFFEGFFAISQNKITVAHACLISGMQDKAKIIKF